MGGFSRTTVIRAVKRTKSLANLSCAKVCAKDTAYLVNHPEIKTELECFVFFVSKNLQVSIDKSTKTCRFLKGVSLLYINV